MISITCESGTFLATPISDSQTLDQHVLERSGTWTATVNTTAEGKWNYWYNPARADLPILSYIGISPRYFAAFLKPDITPGVDVETRQNVGPALGPNIYALGKRIARAPDRVIAAGIRPIDGGNFRLIALCAASAGDIGLQIYYSDVSDLAFSVAIETGDWMLMSIPDETIPGGNQYSSPWFLNGSCTEAACTRIQTVEPRRFFDEFSTTYHRHVVRADIGLNSFTMTDEGNLAPPWKDVAAALPERTGVIDGDWILQMEQECSYADLGPDHPDPCERTGFEYWTRRKAQVFQPETQYDEDLILAVDYLGDTRSHVKAHITKAIGPSVLKAVQQNVWSKYCQNWLFAWDLLDTSSPGPYGFPRVSTSDPDDDVTPCNDHGLFYLENGVLYSGTYLEAHSITMKFDSMPGVEIPVRNKRRTGTVERRWWGGTIATFTDEVDAAGLITFADLRAKVASWLDVEELATVNDDLLRPHAEIAGTSLELGTALMETTIHTHPLLASGATPLTYADSRYIGSRAAVRDRPGNVLSSFHWVISAQDFVANHLTDGDLVTLTGLTGENPRFTNIGVY